MTQTKPMSAVAKTKAGGSTAPKAGGRRRFHLVRNGASAAPAPAGRHETPLAGWRRETGLNRQTFAQLSHVSERSLATYEKQAEVPAAVQAQLQEARRLVEALREIMPGPALKVWLQTPNPGFGGRTPQELNQSGERDLLWEMIYQTRHGAFA